MLSDCSVTIVFVDVCLTVIAIVSVSCVVILFCYVMSVSCYPSSAVTCLVYLFILPVTHIFRRSP